jgi:plasmid stabilization system protein ParE
MPAYQNLYQDSMWGSLPYNPLGIPGWGTEAERRNPWGTSPTRNMRGRTGGAFTGGGATGGGAGESAMSSQNSGATTSETIYNPTSHSAVSNPNSTRYGHTTNSSYVPSQTPRMGPMPPSNHPSRSQPSPLAISTHPPRDIDYGAYDYGAHQRNINARQKWKNQWAAATRQSRNTPNIGLRITGHGG